MNSLFCPSMTELAGPPPLLSERHPDWARRQIWVRPVQIQLRPVQTDKFDLHNVRIWAASLGRAFGRAFGRGLDGPKKSLTHTSRSRILLFIRDYSNRSSPCNMGEMNPSGVGGGGRARGVVRAYFAVADARAVQTTPNLAMRSPWGFRIRILTRGCGP